MLISSRMWFTEFAVAFCQTSKCLMNIVVVKGKFLWNKRIWPTVLQPIRNYCNFSSLFFFWLASKLVAFFSKLLQANDMSEKKVKYVLLYRISIILSPAERLFANKLTTQCLPRKWWIFFCRTWHPWLGALNLNSVS